MRFIFASPPPLSFREASSHALVVGEGTLKAELPSPLLRSSSSWASNFKELEEVKEEEMGINKAERTSQKKGKGERAYLSRKFSYHRIFFLSIFFV